MSARAVQALVRRHDDGTTSILAPDVGWWSNPPSPGQPVAAGGSAGVLTRLGQRFELVLPDGAHGRVTDVAQDRHAIAVAYGQTLFRLIPVDATRAEAPGPDMDDHDAAAAGEAAGGAVVVAPTDGIFYSRPSPGAPPYVEVGQTVRRGQTVGLVEVMKTFNQIAFDGPGQPEEAVVREIRAGEGEEVRAGQVLIVLGP